jgi:hypothetical protein
MFDATGDNSSLASPDDASPSQIINDNEYTVAKAFCDHLNASTNNQRCAGYPHGVGAPNTFQGVYTETLTSITQIAAISAESRLLAGGNITINGSVLNDKSPSPPATIWSLTARMATAAAAAAAAAPTPYKTSPGCPPVPCAPRSTGNRPPGNCRTIRANGSTAHG